MHSQAPHTDDVRLTALIREDIGERRLADLASAIRDHQRSSSGLGGRRHDGRLYRRLRELGPKPEVAS